MKVRNHLWIKTDDGRIPFSEWWVRTSRSKAYVLLLYFSVLLLVRKRKYYKLNSTHQKRDYSSRKRNTYSFYQMFPLRWLVNEYVVDTWMYLVIGNNLSKKWPQSLNQTKGNTSSSWDSRKIENKRNHKNFFGQTSYLRGKDVLQTYCSNIKPGH